MINKEKLIILEIGNSQLIALPSVHYHLGFTVLASSIIRELNPDIIVVELNNAVLKELQKWLLKLDKLPLMLGLKVENSLIPPDLRKNCMVLEHHYKTNLNNIPPEITTKVLNVPDSYVVPLTPTDSIIECIRLAAENSIPIVGIDSHFCIADQYEDDCFMLEDFDGKLDLRDYIEKNAVAAGKLRNVYSDHRREIVMAARLKKLLEPEHKVLFVTGLAHWSAIRRHLFDSSLKPADYLAEDAYIPGIERVILHPAYGYKFIHNLPSVSVLWEENRLSFFRGESVLAYPPDYEKLWRDIYDIARALYEKLCSENNLFRPLTIRQHRIFEDLLYNSKIIRLKPILSMNDILQKAQSVFPDAFNKIFLSQFLEEWSSPEEYPQLPVLVPESLKSGPMPEFASVNWSGNSGIMKYFGKNFSKWFGRDVSEMKYVKRRNKETDYDSILKWKSTWIHPVNEVLLYKLGVDAIKRVEDDEINVVPFEGSFENGINIKRTLKSFSPDGFKIYVNVFKRNKPKETDVQPVVYIFSNFQKKPVSDPVIYNANVYLDDYVKNKTRFKEAEKEGRIFVVNISYYLERGDYSNPDILGGCVCFGDMYINTMAAANFSEQTNYKCFPIIQSSSLSCLNDFYFKKFGLQANLDWQNNLILYGLPYSFNTHRLIVVSPDSFSPSNYVLRIAHKLNVELKLVPHSKFPPEQVMTAQVRMLVGSNDDHGLFFSKEIDAAYEAHLTLLPFHVRKGIESIYEEYSSKFKKNS